jgi:phosphoglucomutase
VDRLKAIWKKHGYFREIGVSGVFKGQSGLGAMKQLMETLRTAPPASLGGIAVLSLKDYLHGTTATLATGKKEKDIDLPSSNVLKFFLADGSSVTARPSGTEPKIKFYVSCRSAAGTAIETATAEVAKKIDALRAHITTVIDSAQQ